MHKKRQMETDLEQYKLYVQQRYGKAAVVFDGHSVEACTKDHQHMRRAGSKVGTVVPPFILSMTLRTKKKEFLSNHDSKQRFTAMLSQRLEQSGCEVHQAKTDADLLIYRQP